MITIKDLKIKLKQYIDSKKTIRKNLEIFETKYKTQYGPVTVPLDWKVLPNHPAGYGVLDTKSLIMWLIENGIYQFRFSDKIKIKGDRYCIDVYFAFEDQATAAKLYWS